MADRASINGIVYILRGNGKVYIGSTERSQEDRMREHRCYSANECTSRLLFESSDDVTMEVLEYVNCNTVAELKDRERHYMEQYPDRVNRQLPGRSIAEWRIDNRDRMLTQMKEYWERTREYRSIEHRCPCGGKYNNGTYYKHIKTKIHLSYLNSLEV